MALIEGEGTDGLYALGEHDAGEVAAIGKCVFSNTCQALGDNDRFKGATTLECTVCNACHTFGDYRGCASCEQSITAGVDDGIAIVA